jgi:hypothetical protein
MTPEQSRGALERFQTFAAHTLALYAWETRARAAGYTTAEIASTLWKEIRKVKKALAKRKPRV